MKYSLLAEANIDGLARTRGGSRGRGSLLSSGRSLGLLSLHDANLSSIQSAGGCNAMHRDAANCDNYVMEINICYQVRQTTTDLHSIPELPKANLATGPTTNDARNGTQVLPARVLLGVVNNDATLATSPGGVVTLGETDVDLLALRSSGGGLLLDLS